MFSESDFQIESIQTIESENERVIEDTVSSVSTEKVITYIKEYFTDLEWAMNEQDFTHVEQDHIPLGSSYQAMLTDIETMSPQESVKVWQMYVEGVDRYDEQHVTVRVYVAMEHVLDGEAYSSDRYNQQLLVNVDPDGHLKIVDIIWTNIME